MLYHDPELYEHKTAVKEVNGKKVLLEETIFYPGGGGQPHDTGKIGNAEVIEVYEENGRIWHKISGEVKKGEKVNLKVDKKRRDSLVRMHTAEHILFRSLQNAIPDISLIKIRLSEDESTIYAHAKKIEWQNLFDAEKEANKIISGNLDIKEHLVSKSELNKFPKLRISERVEDDKVRIIEIDGFDWSACCGIHSLKTGYVENILIIGLNKTDCWEIRFKTKCSDEVLNYSAQARLAASELGCDVESVHERIKGLIKISEDLKEKFRDLSREAASSPNEEMVNGKKLFWKEFQGAEKKQLTDAGKKLAVNKAIVVFVNEEDGKKTWLMQTAEDSEISAEQIMQKMREKGAKGGGRGNAASGVWDGSVDDFKRML